MNIFRKINQLDEVEVCELTDRVVFERAGANNTIEKQNIVTGGPAPSTVRNKFYSSSTGANPFGNGFQVVGNGLTVYLSFAISLEMVTLNSIDLWFFPGNTSPLFQHFNFVTDWMTGGTVYNAQNNLYNPPAFATTNGQLTKMNLIPAYLVTTPGVFGLDIHIPLASALNWAYIAGVEVNYATV